MIIFFLSIYSSLEQFCLWVLAYYKIYVYKLRLYLNHESIYMQLNCLCIFFLYILGEWSQYFLLALLALNF